eukprot:g24086.t1
MPDWLAADIGGPEDQVIALSSLPEPVAAKYYHMRRKMEKIRDKAHHQIEDLKKQKLIEAGIGAVGLEDRRERRKSTQSALALEDQEEPDVLDDENEGEVPQTQPSRRRRCRPLKKWRELWSTGCNSNECWMRTPSWWRFALRTRPLMCQFLKLCSWGSSVAGPSALSRSGDDPFEVVARLQASVAEKLAEIEGMGTDLNFDEVETLRVMSQDLMAEGGRL